MMKREAYIRLEELKLLIQEDEREIPAKICHLLEINSEELLGFTVVKKALDSRNANKFYFVYSLDLELKNHVDFVRKLKSTNVGFCKMIKKHKVREQVPFVYKIPTRRIKAKSRPVIVGSGPAGMFCALVLASAGLKPLLLERGADVATRIKDVDKFFKTGELNTNSNVQFGEGGAGTFSDGKLYTLVNDSRSKFIFDEFVVAGAPKEILSEAHPHIGTDNLREVVKNIREKIISLGGEIRFNSCVTDLGIKKDKIIFVKINNDENLEVSDLVLALGHSARDTYEMLFERGILMLPKTFSMGLRIEHRADMINKAQYGKYFNHPKLPTARYKLVAHVVGERSVYSFCMCPGGYVVAAASEQERLVVNGMSKFAQNNENSNSALLVNVFPSDFASDHPLAGIAFQREWEEKTFKLGGGSFTAPIQKVGDFLESRASNNLGDVSPSYEPNFKLTNLNDCLPKYISDSIRLALPILDKKIKGFAHSDAILSAIESRSSSPLRINRDENFETNIKGLYPIGEGSGYAGGITSSAIDGIKAAEILIAKIK